MRMAALLLTCTLAVTFAPLNASRQFERPLVSTLELDATSGTPITDVRIFGRKLRFALDPLLGGHVTINPKTVSRLGLTGEPNAVKAGLDEITVRGDMTQVWLGLGVREHIVPAALVGRNHNPDNDGEYYDLAGGFEALPANNIIVHLNKDLKGPFREIRFSRRNNDKLAGFPVKISGMNMRLNFHFANSSTWLDQKAAQLLVNERRITPGDDMTSVPVWWGLQMPLQKVEARRPISVNGLRLSPLEARTQEPLILPKRRLGGIVVSRSRRKTTPAVILVGRTVLKDCSQMHYQRREKSLTLRCLANPTED